LLLGLLAKQAVIFDGSEGGRVEIDLVVALENHLASWNGCSELVREPAALEDPEEVRNIDEHDAARPQGPKRALKTACSLLPG